MKVYKMKHTSTLIDRDTEEVLYYHEWDHEEKGEVMLAVEGGFLMKVHPDKVSVQTTDNTISIIDSRWITVGNLDEEMN